MQKLSEAYTQWHQTLHQIEKLSRYTLGSKIDMLFTETLELILYAAYAGGQLKIAAVQKASVKLDALKFFLKLGWQIKAIDNKAYLRISSPLEEIGKMLGGWQKQLTKTAVPAQYVT